MPRFADLIILVLTLAVVAATAVSAQDIPELKFEKYLLDNGLEVILHEDHSTPMVSVNVWYHVGSKNEKPGRTGFAHLFEHMMFQGSANYDRDFFEPLQKIGAQVNGSTTEDRTNYWENVPSDQVELALWLEADRMGFLLPAMTQEKLDNQKDVVKNEKRQGENRPYAKSRQILRDLGFEHEHPYSHTVIGDMADLSAASIEDVSEFFELYYAPNNASLCLAGDFDPAVVKPMIARYFGTIPPGNPVDRLEEWIPRFNGTRFMVAEDAVELPRLYLSWHTPAWFSDGDAAFDLLSSILSGGMNSRLYKSLVYEKQIAQDVRAAQISNEICSEFRITVTAREGVDLAELQLAVDRELELLLDKGINKGELSLAKTSFETGFIRGLEPVGGFGGRADKLNMYNVMCGDPGWLANDVERYRKLTAKDLQRFAKKYLDLENRCVLHIVPQGQVEVAAMDLDRSQVPGSLGPVTFTTPEIETAELVSGLKIYLVEKHDLPLVDINLAIDSGWSSDPAGNPGTASLTAELLDEGTRSRDALAISEEARSLGAFFGSGSFFDGSFINLNVLTKHLPEGLDLMADLVLNPTFPDEELERIRNDYLGRIQQEMSRPNSLAYRTFQRALFGEGHPYAQPFSGTGNAASLGMLQRQDLVDFHREHYLPNNAALIVVGDITMPELKRVIGKAFRKWQPGEVKPVVVPAAAPDSPARVFVVDRPGAQQSFILAGHSSITSNDPDVLGLQVMNTVLGGQFGARINMNLREDKGYTYGAYTNLLNFKHAGALVCQAPVQTQFTAAAMVEILGEITGITGDRPVTVEEAANARNRMIKGFPQRFETVRGTSRRLRGLVQDGRPLDDWQSYVGRVEGFDRDRVDRMANKHVASEQLIWVIVGDWSVIGESVTDLNLGAVEQVDVSEL